MTKQFQRYGIFFTPTGPLAKAGAEWLGWDLATGCPVGSPDETVVKRPQKYGFHATIKPPFYLAEGQSAAELQAVFATLCKELSPVSLAELSIASIARFIALVPKGDIHELVTFAGRVVSHLDEFRAPASMEELARRRQSNLSSTQEHHLLKWGYPYVFEQFKFHMTLTGPLKPEQIQPVMKRAKSTFAPVLPTPFVIDALSLVGERTDGMFELITRQPLA